MENEQRKRCRIRSLSLIILGGELCSLNALLVFDHVTSDNSNEDNCETTCCTLSKRTTMDGCPVVNMWLRTAAAGLRLSCTV